MNVIIVSVGTLGEAFDNLRKAFLNAICFDELITYEEEIEYKERISFPHNVVKVLKSQVMDRKPRCIRARTVC
ncbi:hypothetical protein J0803_11125 [Bacillus cereus]|uniref:hypothetical protein n=1 Tax=Bacillus cereus group TaxID=86661 RepID=UPI000B7D66A1|nr:hypothetical protein [Bacillus cereus]MCU5350041.1 hypothetical protein [Bacillus cereus]MDA2112775.1 hypothetical protein [Bacillus cereus]MDA2130596.1 hypothetical protein [Bacillus cereus]MDA2152429.1 hypothetical protein [Bacillus cereus]MDZ4455355.1 hypothetical protein [Bacillus cereus]